MLKKFTFIVIAILIPILSQAATINNIKIVGNHRISNATIMAYVKLQKGEEYKNKLADQSIKDLYKTGFFSDVKIQHHDGNIKIILVENPLVGLITFEGNDKLSNNQLKKEISMKEYTVYSAAKVDADIKKIIALYHKHGRYNAKVTVKLMKKDNNRVNLVYEIHEGTKSTIQNISFIGNHAYPDIELSKVISSKAKNIFNFFSSDDLYDESRLLYDQELLRHFYMNNGFADFYVNSVNTEISGKNHAFIITFTIHEGEIYHYGNIGISSSISSIKANDLRKLINLKKGDKFNLNDIENVSETIRNHLGDEGYAFANVDFDVSLDKNNKLVNLDFKVQEGPKIYINRINIFNNTRTLDKVIRREFRLNEGDPYNQAKILRTQQRIRALDYFGNVEFKNTPTQFPDKMDVNVNVEEKATGSINFAMGYSTSDGPLGQVNMSERNFLGRGQEVDLTLSKAQRSTNVDFSFTEPYFNDMPLAVGFDLFKNIQGSTKRNNYHSRTIGGSFRLSYNLSEYLRHNVHYTFKREGIYQVPEDASIYVKNEIGKYINSSVGHSLIYNKLDDISIPSDGYLVKFNQDFAGVGGNTKYIKHGLNATYYYPIYKRKVVLGLSVSAGNIHAIGNKSIRLNDRYFIGSDQIRGFESSGIGPRDKDGESLGGNSYYVGTAELNFPLGLPEDLAVRGATFLDVGSLFGNPIKSSQIYKDHAVRATYGVGIIWYSKMAKIRLDYGIPFRKKKYDQIQKFRIQLGTDF